MSTLMLEQARSRCAPSRSALVPFPHSALAVRSLRRKSQLPCRRRARAAATRRAVAAWCTAAWSRRPSAASTRRRSSSCRRRSRRGATRARTTPAPASTCRRALKVRGVRGSAQRPCCACPSLTPRARCAARVAAGALRLANHHRATALAERVAALAQMRAEEDALAVDQVSARCRRSRTLSDDSAAPVTPPALPSLCTHQRALPTRAVRSRRTWARRRWRAPSRPSP